MSELKAAALFEATGVHDGRPLSASERVRIRETLAMLPADTRSLLEVGAGDGVLISRATVPLRVAADAARRGLRHVPCAAVQCSITALPFPDFAFDVVLCAETLEHLPADVLPAAARELRRVARRAVVVTTPWAEDLESGRARCPDCGALFHVNGHVNSLGPADLKALFPDARAHDIAGAWPVRRFSPWLLHVRHRWFGQRPWSRHTLCPRCQGTKVPRNDRRAAWRAIGALNTALHPRRDRHNWLLMRAWYDPGEPNA